MKKMVWIILAAGLMCTAAGAMAENDALDAFSQLTGKTITLNQTGKTSEMILGEVMDGMYLTEITGTDVARQLAAALPGLTSVTSKDIATYAQANTLASQQVRNAYYRSLANVLRAEIMVNPSSEERYKNIQIILSLFLDDEDSDDAVATRSAIRSSMSKDNARSIAESYNLPTGFVQFVIMDDDWNDDQWENDNDWVVDSGWTYNTDDMIAGSADVDTVDYDSADDVYASVDTASPDDNSVDVATPDTPDTPAATTSSKKTYNSPDTPDYDTPEVKKPAATPKKTANNSPDTPDYNSGSSDYEDS